MLPGRKHSRDWDIRVSPVEEVRRVDIARRYRRHPSEVVRACTPSASVARSSSCRVRRCSADCAGERRVRVVVVIGVGPFGSGPGSVTPRKSRQTYPQRRTVRADLPPLCRSALRPAQAERAAVGQQLSRRPMVTSEITTTSRFDIAGTGGNAGQAGYSSGKAGVIGLTKTMAKEWGRYQVTVNGVAFGLN